jgi:hypothetical protein
MDTVCLKCWVVLTENEGISTTRALIESVRYSISVSDKLGLYLYHELITDIEKVWRQNQ